jgi:hypothetical protein
MRLAHHRHAALLHGLEQRALCLGRGAVDLIGEHEAGKQRPGAEDEAAPPVHLLEHRIARDVAGQEIGGELDALRVEAEGFREALHELRLAEAGQALEEQVSAREEAGDHLIHERLLAEEHFIERGAQFARLGGGVLQFGFAQGDGAHLKYFFKTSRSAGRRESVHTASPPWPVL